MFKKLLGAVFAIGLSVTGANATTVTGTFTVVFANVSGLNSTQSQATLGNVTSAIGLANGDPTPGFGTREGVGAFTYTGALDFGTSDPNDGTTIGQWLESGSGDVTGIGGNPLSAGISPGAFDLQLSKPNISNGTATSTFFFFSTSFADALDVFVTHDDGFALFDDGVRIGGVNGPISQRTTRVDGFDGGFFEFAYVATNGDPSVLIVQAVPVPAALPLMLAGLGGLFAMRRRARKAAA